MRKKYIIYKVYQNTNCQRINNEIAIELSYEI